MDTKNLFLIHAIGAYFVIGEKTAMLYQVEKDRNYCNKETGIMADQIIRLTGQKTSKCYPQTLRRIVFYDSATNRTFVYYTNNLEISAENVALLYKYRWRVELFYKWIKQHLCIKSFWGTTEDAVKTQIYIALITYCLVAIVEHELKLKRSTYDVLRILSISLLDKSPLKELFEKPTSVVGCQNDRQLNLNLF
jgi:hypothetical protein